MKWTKITIKTTTAAEDIIISALYDLGLESALIEDKIPLSPLEKEQLFIDIIPEGEADDGIAFLSFFREVPEQVSENDHDELETLISLIKTELNTISAFCDIGEGSITISETLDLDWINNWKQYFHKFYIDDLLIVPSWETIEADEQSHPILRIDPGAAFGTGLHETTQLCIRSLRKYLISNAKLLDVGCGSGILSIIGLMFGAKKAVGIDIDVCAVNACADNKQMNQISDESFDVKIGNILTDNDFLSEIGQQTYDILTANILAEVLVTLAPKAFGLLKESGIIISSGILNEKTDMVMEAFTNNGFECIETQSQGEWSLVVCRKLHHHPNRKYALA